jgi:hypothetical protein
MAQLSRIQVQLDGAGVVGGGLSTFYSTASTPTTFLAAVRQFYSDCSSLFPTNVGFTFPGDGDVFEDSTGTLVGDWVSAAPAPVAGTWPDEYAAGVGARMVWRTAGITRGRRVRGSTFMVPLAGNCYDDDGSITGAVTTLLAAAAAPLILADGASMRIWSRPSATGASDGDSHGVTAVQVPGNVTWLRSRRT